MQRLTLVTPQLDSVEACEPVELQESGVFRAVKSVEECGPEGRNWRLREALAAYALEFGLSSQEQRLLECAVQGLNDKTAANVLRCSPNTVGTYWRRIYVKVSCFGARDVLAHFCRVTLASR